MSIRTKDDTSNRLICLYILCTKVAPAPKGDRLPSDTAEIDALFVDIESSKKKREFKLCQQIMNKIHDLRERNHKKSSPVAALEIQLEDAKARRDFARCRTLQRQIEAAKAPSARAQKLMQLESKLQVAMDAGDFTLCEKIQKQIDQESGKGEPGTAEKIRALKASLEKATACNEFDKCILITQQLQSLQSATTFIASQSSRAPKRKQPPATKKTVRHKKKSRGPVLPNRIRQMKVKEIRAQLALRNIDTSGTKSLLMQRLAKAERATNDQPDTTSETTATASSAVLDTTTPAQTDEQKESTDE